MINKQILTNNKLYLISYILLSTTLFLYLYFLNFYELPDLFWPLIIATVIVIMLHIIFLKGTKSTIILIAELTIFNLLLHGIYQLPFTYFYGNDAHVDMRSLSYIIINGHISLNSSLASTALWPMIHIFGDIIYNIINLDLNTTIKTVPFLIELPLPLLLYVLFNRILYKNENQDKISLLSILIFIVTFNHIEFNSFFIRETYAIPIMVIILFMYYLLHRTKNYLLLLVIVFLLVELTFAHHFTAFMLLLLLLIMALYDIITKRKNIFIYYLIPVFAILLFADWMFISLNYSPLAVIVHIIGEIIGLSAISNTYSSAIGIADTGIATTRGFIVYYGFFLLNAIFAIIMLIKFKFLKEVNSFTLYLFTCGIIGIATLYVLPISIFPDRLLTYGWLIGALPLALAIYSFKNKALRAAILIIVLIFILHNIYRIDPEFYTSPRMVINQPFIEDHLLAEKLNVTEGKILASENNGIVFTDLYGYTYNPLYTENMKGIYDKLDMDSHYYDYIIINDRFVSNIYDKNLTRYYGGYIEYIKGLSSDKYYIQVLDSDNNRVYCKV